MTDLKEQKKRQGKEVVCRKCNGTGWLHGCQRWTPAKMKRGTPYYSERCDCQMRAA